MDLEFGFEDSGLRRRDLNVGRAEGLREGELPTQVPEPANVHLSGGGRFFCSGRNLQVDDWIWHMQDSQGQRICLDSR